LRIVTSSDDKTARVWDVAVDSESPLPAWIPELAEALGEQRFNEEGLLVPPKKSVLELRRELLALKGDDFWSHFGRWFFMRGPERTISPGAKITVGEITRQQLQEEADQGIAAAQINLGWLYQNGEGVPKDLGRAAELYQKAANQGEPIAQNNLGELYRLGEGVPKDLAKAAELYQKAAEGFQKEADQGNAQAQLLLGVFYENGWGVPNDLGKARELYQKAANKGHELAITQLKALQGNALAQFNLGLHYQKGDELPKDIAKARELYQKSANQGYEPAITQLKALSRDRK
jgi:hypothetical protein